MAVTKEQVLKIADIVTKNNLSVKRPANSIAVDTLSRPADERVDRSVGIVNDFQTRNASPALTNGIRNAVSTTPPSQPDAQRQMLSDLEAEIRGASVAEERQKAFSDAGLVQKEERARTLSNQLVQRERDFQKQREELELNKKGKGEIAYNADLARFDRESSRTLADMAINYQVALGDYNAAQELVNQYVADYQTDLQNRQNSWQMLYNLYQNDMTESEQIQAQQNFQREQVNTQFELSKKLASFNQTLSENDPLYQANLRTTLAQAESAEKQKEMLENAIENGDILLTKDQKDTAFKLQDDYEKESDEFIKQADAYDRIIASAEDPSAAGDLALIFNYMKVLDPGSTVREGEFANAQNSGSIPSRIVAQYNSVLRGERLADTQRNDFVNRATKLYDATTESQDKRVEQFMTRSAQFGVPPEVVVRDVYSEGRNKADEILKNNLLSEEESGFISSIFGQYKTQTGFDPINFFNQR